MDIYLKKTLTELGNVGVICTEERDKVRNRADSRVYNYQLNIMEGKCNFRQDPFRERGRGMYKS
jgi:hypothetical protein